MLLRIAADLVLVTHLLFIVFVVAGGSLVIRWPRLAWLHLPAAAWGAYVEIAARICPLTYLENALRVRAGQAGYEGSFIEQYIVPIIYPTGLTRSLQWWLAGLVITVNLLVYGYVLLRRRKARINGVGS